MSWLSPAITGVARSGRSVTPATQDAVLCIPSTWLNWEDERPGDVDRRRRPGPTDNARCRDELLDRGECSRHASCRRSHGPRPTGCTMTRRAPSIFICYRRADEPFAAALMASILEDAVGGDEVFLDTLYLGQRGPFTSALIAAVRNCRIVLAVV